MIDSIAKLRSNPKGVAPQRWAAYYYSAIFVRVREWIPEDAMEVFISWSGSRSNQLARALRDWLPEVIQQVNPWMSTEDIAKGQRWLAEIGTRLQKGSQGIICVTAENMASPWLNFEAGALAKSLTEARVRPILLNIEPADVTGPIAQFQATISTDSEDMLRLISSINETCATPLSAGRLQKAFHRSWVEFSAAVDAISKSPESSIAPEIRDTDDVLREVLEGVRELLRVRPQDAYSVVLESYAKNKIQAIRIARQVTGIGLKEAKDLVESAPAAVLDNVSREEAERIAAAFEAEGCIAGIRLT
ncbi:ribosomal protein L7/L12 [Micromonospora sp. CA-111912]|uniref:ribosomal protein L7/L12 n=1 Tax=Micromonospora sp. CA-111912 TaxID=3239955 RepID=UPI003D8FFA06